MHNDHALSYVLFHSYGPCAVHKVIVGGLSFTDLSFTEGIFWAMTEAGHFGKSGIDYII